MSKKLWKHPKQKYLFTGSYEFIKLKKSSKTERVFVLTSSVMKNGNVATVSFDSYQQAKKQGWTNE